MSGPARKMSLLQATMLVAGNMIGTGVFLLPVNMASVGGIAIFGWVVATAGAAALGYSRATRSSSSHSTGNGQPMPAARARRRHSCTVERAEPIAAAISRSLNRASALSLSTSRILRTDNLACATVDLPGNSPKRSR